MGRGFTHADFLACNKKLARACDGWIRRFGPGSACNLPMPAGYDVPSLPDWYDRLSLVLAYYQPGLEHAADAISNRRHRHVRNARRRAARTPV